MKRLKKIGTSQLRFLSVIALFVACGLAALYITHATQTNIAVQAESGTPSSPSLVTQCTNTGGASGSKCVQFNAATPPPPPGSVTVVAAGDIACTSGAKVTCEQDKTASLIKSISNVSGVITLGDNAYNSGLFSEYTGRYDPSWGGVIKAMTYPGIGNHEYFIGGHFSSQGTNAGYVQYFANTPSAAGNTADPNFVNNWHASNPTGSTHTPLPQVWYSYDIGNWHFISLDSNCSMATTGGCSAMNTWLATDLRNHPKQCTAAYWHIPFYSAYTEQQYITNPAATPAAASVVQYQDPVEDEYSPGEIGPSAIPNTSAAAPNTGVSYTAGAPWMTPIWQTLYNANVDVVLEGHTHDYERFLPMDSNKKVVANGITSFVVGTGGAGLSPMWTANVLNTQVPQLKAYTPHHHGVLKMVLKSGSMDYAFMSIPGEHVDGYNDSGTINCH